MSSSSFKNSEKTFPLSDTLTKISLMLCPKVTEGKILMNKINKTRFIGNSGQRGLGRNANYGWGVDSVKNILIKNIFTIAIQLDSSSYIIIGKKKEGTFYKGTFF